MNYFSKNFKHIMGTFLITIFFVFFIFSFLINLEFFKNLFFETSIGFGISFTAIILVVLIYSWEKASDLWLRYRNKNKLENPPFVFLDFIFFFIIFSTLLICIFQNHHIPYFSLKFHVFLLINMMSILTWFLTSYFWKKKTKMGIRKIEKYSLSDEPIQFEEQDLLGRKKFVDDLYKEITNITSNDSFVFGLYGSWGEGKTSVRNLLINKFELNKNFILVNFDPWHFKDEKAILNAFYRQIERKLSNKYIFPDLKKKFIKYQKIILSGISSTGIKVDLPIGEITLEETKKKIESHITQNKIKILILIDNIDRLHADEILFVFKLIRLNTKFQNTIFLLCFDNNLVKDQLERKHVQSDFIEKIVQKPIQLPKIEQRSIDNFLGEHIEKFLDEIEVPNEEKTKFINNFSSFYLIEIRKLFKTLRHAKRYLNSLRFTLPPIKNEINLYDLFIFEVIKVFYPKVIDDIWENPWFYVPLEWSKRTMFLSPFGFIDDGEKKNSIIKDHIEKVVKDEKENEILKKMLGRIFFVTVKNALKLIISDESDIAEDHRVEKRITHPDSFVKYFILKVPSLEISDAYMATTLDVWNSIERTKKESVIKRTIFNMQEQDRLVEFFKMLIVFIDKISQDTPIHLIKIIYENAKKFSKKGGETFLGDSEYNRSASLLFRLINDKIEQNNIQRIIEETITRTPSFHFAALVVLYCKKERIGSLFNISNTIKIEQLKNRLSNRLKKYFIDENRDIFDEMPDKSDLALVLYQWATDWGAFTSDNRKAVSGYILSIIRKDAKKFFMFITDIGLKTRFETTTFDLGKIDKVCDLVELYKLAEEFKDDISLSEEEKNLINLFLESYRDKKINNEKKSQVQKK